MIIWKRNVLDRAATVLWALEQNAVNEMYIFENSVMEEKREQVVKSLLMLLIMK